MRKLLQSPKFWAITIGAALGCTAYYFLGDGEGLTSTFPMLLVGAYSSVALAGKAEEIAKNISVNKKQGSDNSN